MLLNGKRNIKINMQEIYKFINRQEVGYKDIKALGEIII